VGQGDRVDQGPMSHVCRLHTQSAHRHAGGYPAKRSARGQPAYLALFPACLPTPPASPPALSAYLPPLLPAHLPAPPGPVLPAHLPDTAMAASSQGLLQGGSTRRLQFSAAASGQPGRRAGRGRRGGKGAIKEAGMVRGQHGSNREATAGPGITKQRTTARHVHCFAKGRQGWAPPCSSPPWFCVAGTATSPSKQASKQAGRQAGRQAWGRRPFRRRRMGRGSVLPDRAFRALNISTITSTVMLHSRRSMGAGRGWGRHLQRRQVRAGICSAGR